MKGERKKKKSKERQSCTDTLADRQINDSFFYGKLSPTKVTNFTERNQMDAIIDEFT